MLINVEEIKNIVLEAGKILRRYYSKNLKVSYKGPRDLVTEADIRVEEFIKESLYMRYPKIEFLGEETGTIEKKETAFILDPLDGTTNFAHHFPFFCISLALVMNSEIKLGFIYDPLRGELFSALENSGAYLNGKKIRVSNTASLKGALLATGFPYADDTVAKSLSYFNHILPFCQGIRRAGAAALDLAYTACGRFDGFFELNLKPWDVAAGILIVREAGGIVTDLSGYSSSPYDGNIVATNGLIHHEVIRIVDKADKTFKEFSNLYRSSVFGEDSRD
ncbi:MAG: inositol monophosphatase family protein [bacterium]